MKHLVTILAILSLLAMSPLRVMASGNTYATWNPADKNAGITLSNGNLTATHTAATAWILARSTIGVSSGKWYWELTIGARGANNGHDHGAVSGSASLSAETNANTSQAADYLSQGFRYCNQVETAGIASYTTGDVLGFALDMGGHTMQFFKNNVSQGTCSGAMTGTEFAAVSYVDLNDAVTANFGATTMTYTAPSGFNQGLYTPGSSAFNFGWFLGF